MQITEKVETINQSLQDLYGIDTISGLPIWRVVWSEDQFEHRHGEYTDFSESGLYLRTVTETRYVPKYRQWIRERYVLERLVLIPEISSGDLPATKMSYEPIFPFEGNNGCYLPPKLVAAKFIIETVLSAQGKSTLAKYKDPLAGLTKEQMIEAKDEEIKKLQSELFGNESEVGDALAHKEAIVVPRSYKGES